MSPEREEIIARFWKRLSSVTGVVSTARNPVNPPKASDLPRINFFEMEDSVASSAQRGASQYPAFKRELRLLVETFIKASAEAAAPKELAAFVSLIKKKVYEGGVTLGLPNVMVSEVSCSEVLRPPDLDLVCGVGIILSIRYAEDVSNLYD